MPIALAIGIAVLVAGCQTVPVGTREAPEPAQTPVMMVPPPRAVTDILAMLDRQRFDPAETADLRAVADEERPSTIGLSRRVTFQTPAWYGPATSGIRVPGDSLSASDLASFFHRRGVAARELGRASQAVDDLSQANWAAQSQGYGAPRYRILFDLAQAELLAWSFGRALETGREAIRETPPDQPGQLIAVNAFMARLYATIGDVPAAEAAVRAAQRALRGAASYPNSPLPRLVAEADIHAARAAINDSAGTYVEAEAAWRQTVATLRRSAAASKDPVVETYRANLAEALLRQGRLSEAEHEAREAVLGTVRKRGRNTIQTALALRVLIRVIAEQGRYVEAERLARVSLDIYDSVRVVNFAYFRLLAWEEIGAALIGQERWQDALLEYDEMAEALKWEHDAQDRHLTGNVNRAIAYLETRQPDRACPILRVAFERTSRLLGGRHAGTAQVRALLVIACVAPSDRAGAARELSEIIPVLFAGRQEVEDEAGTRPAQEQRLALILDAHIRLLTDAGSREADGRPSNAEWSEAFRMADVSRGRIVQRAIEASAARATAGTPALAGLVRREQDAKKRLTAVYGALGNALSDASGEQNPALVARLRAEIDALRAARESSARDIASRFPEYAALVNPPPPTAEDVRASLRAGEALVSIYVGRDRTLVWALGHGGASDFAAVPIGDAEIEVAVTTLRQALDLTGRPLDTIPEFDVALAYQLYRQLLEPVRGVWGAAHTLFIVPHGALTRLPFGVLPTAPTSLGSDGRMLFAKYAAVPWLIRTHAVTVLPSVATLTVLRALPAADPTRRPFIGFGDPVFAGTATDPIQSSQKTARGELSLEFRRVPDTRRLDSSRLAMLPRLPDTADEIRTMAQLLQADPAREVFLGVRANEQTVKTADLARYRVIAFATHGLVPGDLDGLTQPALALSAPDLAGIDGDGLLTMDEILALRLDADWVVLSACNTASGSGAGAQAVSGLGRAFFYAGSRSILVSNWAVETRSARMLTTGVFRRQTENPGLSRARALQETMKALLEEEAELDGPTGRVAFSYAHPVFWAPFTLVGDGG